MAGLTIQSGPYVPRKEADFRRWAFVFTRRLSLEPAAAGLSADIAAELAAAFDEYNAAYHLAAAPSTRTITTVARRSDLRRSLEAALRLYAQRIKKNNEVTDEVKHSLHLHTRRKRRRRVPRPNSLPLLSIVGARSGRHTLRFNDGSMGLALRKPKDAAALQLFAAVGARSTGDPGQARYVGTYTRQPIRVDWPIETAGQTITYFGRWITRTGREGPWSAPAAMQIAFGGSALAEIERFA